MKQGDGRDADAPRCSNCRAGCRSVCCEYCMRRGANESAGSARSRGLGPNACSCAPHRGSGLERTPWRRSQDRTAPLHEKSEATTFSGAMRGHLPSRLHRVGSKGYPLPRKGFSSMDVKVVSVGSASPISPSATNLSSSLGLGGQGSIVTSSSLRDPRFEEKAPLKACDAGRRAHNGDSATLAMGYHDVRDRADARGETPQAHGWLSNRFNRRAVSTACCIRKRGGSDHPCICSGGPRSDSRACPARVVPKC